MSQETTEYDSDVESALEGEWEILKYNSKYKIWNQFPFPIQKICTHQPKCKLKLCNHPVKESINPQGYYQVSLSKRTIGKHRIIAMQWIENDDPENKIHVDHVNRIRCDNRIENLRWTTFSQNLKNAQRKKSEYVQELPKTAIRIDNYTNIELVGYWYDPIDERLYLKTPMEDNPWKIIKPSRTENIIHLNLTDINGKQWCRSWQKFVQQMSEIM